MMTPIRSVARTLIAGSLLLGSAVAAPSVLADDHNDDDDRLATYIYAGTIDAVDDASVVEDIDELERDDEDDLQAAWQHLGDGQDMPDELYIGDEDLDDNLVLDDLTGEPHMIVVHETEDRSSDIVAIGMIEGTVSDDGSLLIQLNAYEGSDWEGRAWIGPDQDDDDDDNELEVIVGVYPAGAVTPLGTPESVG